MTRKVFIGVLAALMLFAFTACEGNSGYQVLRDAGVATTTVDYLVGEKVNPSDFTFIAYNYDGSEREIPAADVVLVSGGDTDAAGVITPIFGWNGVKFVGAAEVYTVDSIEVDATNAATKVYYTTEDADYQNVDLSGVVITAKYTVDGTEKTKVVDSALAKGTIADWTTADEDATVTVTFGGKNGDYTVDLQKNLISTISFAAADTTKKYYVDDTVTSAAFKMVGNMLNGEEKTLTAGTDYMYYNATAQTYTLSAPSVDTSKAATVSVRAKYVGSEGVVGLAREGYQANLVINEDKVVGIIVDASSLASGTPIDTKDSTGYGLSVSYEMESGKSGSALTYNAAEDGFTVSPVEFKSKDNGGSYEVGDRVQITVVAGSYSKTVQTTLTAKV